jgi:NitT/TauT family transport system ATP-binding protein
MTYQSSSGDVVALDNVSFGVQPGEFLSLLGPSGCGKSTLLMIAAGLIVPSRGRVMIDGHDVAGPQTDIGIVFQDPVLLDWRSAVNNVLLQIEARPLRREIYEPRARQLLQRVGLRGFEDKLPFELSGGMKQRVSICRALVHDPPLLLMDEPFGALDALTREQLGLDLQRIVSETKKTVIFVTHSIPEAIFLADRVVVMTPRPGTVDRIVDIRLPRPRSVHMFERPEFGGYERVIREIFVARGILAEGEDEPI